MKKCHECDSRFTQISYLVKGGDQNYLSLSYHYDVVYLCRTCTYIRSTKVQDKFRRPRIPLIIPFVKIRTWPFSDTPV